MGSAVYLFDFDGTLVDSMPHWSEKMLNILRQCGISGSVELISYIATLGDLGTAKYFREELGVPYTVDRMLQMMDDYALPKYCFEIPLKEGVREMLMAWKQSGIRLAVLTASPHRMLDPCLKRLGVFDWFDYVWSTDDFGNSKNNPAIYGQVADALGVTAKDITFFDDNLNAVRAAGRAGLRTVGVYDLSAEAYRRELEAACDQYVLSFPEFRMD